MLTEKSQRELKRKRKMSKDREIVKVITETRKVMPRKSYIKREDVEE